MRERRTARRFTVNWEILVEPSRSAKPAIREAAILHNLSSHGAFFTLPHAIEPGTRVEIVIKLPLQRENWMKYEAEVVRTEPHSFGFGIAAKFATPKPIFFSPGSVDRQQAVKKS